LNTHHQGEIARIVDRVICERRSIRSFTDQAVEEQLLRDILQVASRAPSGSNIQPWKVYVLTGPAKDRLSQKIIETVQDPEKNASHQAEYVYYPKTWREPFLSRRRKVGLDLYTLLGIGRGDQDKMQTQHLKNFNFFGAPVGLVLTIDRSMEQGSWLDYGMFVQNILISAQAHGLATCPQAAFIAYHDIFAQEIGFPNDEQLVCCISLGYENLQAVENQLITEREPIDQFVRFLHN